MEKQVVSMREIQRNYRKVLHEAKKYRKPVFLGAHGKAQAVLMDIEDYQALQQEKEQRNRQREWRDIEAVFDRLARAGEQSVSLSEFVHHDRKAH